MSKIHELDIVVLKSNVELFSELQGKDFHDNINIYIANLLGGKIGYVMEIKDNYFTFSEDLNYELIHIIPYSFIKSNLTLIKENGKNT